MISFCRKATWFYSSWQEYTSSGFEEASKKFSDKDLDISVRGKSYLITGANSSIGHSIACEIARHGGTIHMVCRNHHKGEYVQTAIMNETGNQDIHLHLVDLSHPRDVFRFTHEFREQIGKVDVLWLTDDGTHVPKCILAFNFVHIILECLQENIHNAGSMVVNRHVDPDGVEKNFAVNVLAPHILTRQFIPLLHKSQSGRVIFISSGGMLVQKLDPTDIQCQRMKLSDFMLIYANHKRQQVVLAEIYSREYPNVFCASMHPGWVDTPGMKDLMPEFYSRMRDRLRSPKQGADTAVWLAIAEQPVNNTSGLFYQDRTEIPTHLPMSFTKASLLEEESFIKQLDHLMERASKH